MIRFHLSVYQGVKTMKVLSLLFFSLGDLLDCEFMGCVLYWPRVHSLVQSLIKSTPNKISLSDINYATEGKSEEDVIGICLTAGYLKLFRMIRFDLMKLKLMYSQLTLWNTQPQHGNTQIDINYRIEAAVSSILLIKE